MTRLCVAPIVEGHGEDKAVRILLQRIWNELLGQEYIHVLRPIRGSRHKLVRREDLERAISLAASKLRGACTPGDPTLILVLLDADTDPACTLGPRLLDYATKVRPDADVACVLADVEYETWFVAAAESLRDFLDFPVATSDSPQKPRAGKRWIQKHFKRPKYSETLDQPGMTAKMDLELCRSKSDSFDKLCRELESRSKRARDSPLGHPGRQAGPALGEDPQAR